MILKTNVKSLGNFPVLGSIPTFYQDILLAFNNCKTIKPIDNCNPLHIMTEIIWGNEMFKFRKCCLYNKNWIDSNIVYCKDLFTMNGEVLPEIELIHKLKDARNWIGEYSMI